MVISLTKCPIRSMRLDWERCSQKLSALLGAFVMNRESWRGVLIRLY